MNTSIYAKPVMPRILLRPALATLALHGLIIALLTVNWSSTEREVIRSKPVPMVINARLVDVSEFQPKPKPKPRPAAQPRPKKPAVVTAKPKPTPKPQPKAKVSTPKVTPKPKAKATPKPEPRISRDELAELARAELSTIAAQEEATTTADEMAASFVGLIQRTVISYWSRPPSARNGMETELAIKLIPTGEVVSVTVISSSGNTAFDRSAINAVEKAGAFPELQQLPIAKFDKSFRHFRLLFKPEDLRY